MAAILEIYFKIAVCGIASVFGLGEDDDGVCKSYMWVKPIFFQTCCKRHLCYTYEVMASVLV